MDVFITKESSFDVMYDVKKIFVSLVKNYVNIQVLKFEEPFRMSYTYETPEQAKNAYLKLKDMIYNNTKNSIEIRMPSER